MRDPTLGTAPQLQAETNEGLFKEGLVADLTLKLSKVRAEELSTRHDLEKKRLDVYEESAKAQIRVVSPSSCAARLCLNKAT